MMCVTFGICRKPPTTASTASAPIASFIVGSRSAMWCSGPGKPTSVSSTSPLAGFVWTSAWCRWPSSSSRASAHRLAVERAEDHPERVDPGQERARVAGDVEAPVPAAAVADEQQDLVLGEEARERRHAGERQAADAHAAERERHRLLEAAHPVEVLLARHRGDHRAGGHEEQRLEEGVRHEVKQARGVGARADGHDHVADLGHRRVGDDALQVGDGDRDRARDEQRQAADDRADVGRGRRQLEERVHAGDEVDAGGDHRGRVDERGDRRRALHGVGQPGVQRDLGGLRERADEQQDAARGEVGVALLEDLGRLLERGQEVDACRRA